MTTFLVMAARPFMVLLLAAFLARAVAIVKAVIPDGSFKKILLLHLWDTDSERDKKSAQFKES